MKTMLKPKHTHKLKRIGSILAIVTLLAQSFWLFHLPIASAQIPAEYKPNYKFATERAKIEEILYKIDAKKKNGQAVETFHFSSLLQNFNVVFNYLPQTPEYKSVYESCRVGAEELSTAYDINTMSLFSNNCLTPINEIFKEIVNKYTVKAKVVASPPQGSAPLTVTFDWRWSSDEASKTTIPSNNYFWYFTDTNGVEQSIGRWPVVKYTFKKEGNYVVHLTVRSANADAKGIFDGEATTNINVGPQAANLITFANGKRLKEDIPIKFTSQEAADGLRIDGSATTPLGGRQIMKHEWQVTNSNGENLYKNGGNNAPSNFRVSMPSNGSYTVTLKILDNENNTVEKTYEIIIADPIATIKVSPNDWGNTSSIYSFDASTSYSVQSTLKTYTRTITDSDGNEVATSKGKTLQQKFPKPGTYRVKLRVIDELGNDNEEAATIEVSSTPPVPQFTIEPVKQRHLPSQFILDASPSYDVDTANDNDALSYEWTFSNNDNVTIDQTYDNGKRIKVSFKEKWAYKITLNVKDRYGKIAETVKDQDVASSLRPYIFVNPVSTQLGNSTTFKAKTNKLVANYEWDFGDGNTRKVQDDQIVHTYKKVGNYRIKLTVTTADWDTNSVFANAFIGEANSPIPAFTVANQQADVLIPEWTCKDPSGAQSPAFLVERYQEFVIDGSESVNVQWGKDNLLFYFKPQNGDTAKRQQMRHKFDEVGCQFMDFTVEDTAISKTSSTRLWFFVTNAKPKIQNILMTFPQLGNTYGIGIGQNAPKDIFKTDVDPLVVKIDAVNTIDTDWSISKYKWYYYNIDDPQRWLEIKYTPANIPYVYFSIPRLAWEYRFGVEAYDNDGESTKSEESIGKWPVVFFPPDSKNPDIPIVTLRVDKINTKVGEQVTLEAIAKITSNRNDFLTNRTISYDFDGDGERDMTTKDDKVTYVYKNVGTFSPRVKVTYRSRTGIAYGETVTVEKWVKAWLLYAVVWNTLIARDTSYGEITNRKFCTDVRQCRNNAASIIENQTYFKKEYTTSGKYLVRYDVEDKNGNASSLGSIIVNATEPAPKDAINLITLPAPSQDGTVAVGKSLENKILFYAAYQWGDCYIDTDISKDSTNKWQPDQNRDIACNVETLYEYKNPSVGSTIARLYYAPPDSSELQHKDITIQFLDYAVELPSDIKATYDKIESVLIRLWDNLPDLKSILLQLRNGIVAWDDTSSLVLQLKDVIENKQGSIDPLTQQQLDDILITLEDKTTVSAQWGTKYAQARSTIIDLFPTNRKSEIATLFEEIDNAAWDKAKIKNLMFKILDIGKEEFDKKAMDEIDMQWLQQEVCTIINYYEITGTTCKVVDTDGEEIAQPTIETTDSSSTSLGRKIAKVVGIIVGILWAWFVILVIIFALKAKKKQESAG